MVACVCVLEITKCLTTQALSVEPKLHNNIMMYKIQDTNQFIGNHVGWIVIYIIHNTIQAS